jgi:glutaredoxin 2
VDVFGALKSHVNSGDPSTLSPYKYSPSTNVFLKPKNNLFTKATFSVVALSMIELKDALQYLPGVKNIMIGTSNSKKLQKYIQVSYDNHVISYNELLQQVWTYIQRIHASVRADSGAVVAIHYQGEEQRQRAQQFYDEISGFLMQLPAIQVNIERLSVLVNFNNDDLLSEVSDVISYDQDVAVNINNDKLLSNIEGWQSSVATFLQRQGSWRLGFVFFVVVGGAILVNQLRTRKSTS